MRTTMKSQETSGFTLRMKCTHCDLRFEIPVSKSAIADHADDPKHRREEWISQSVVADLEHEELHEDEDGACERCGEYSGICFDGLVSPVLFH